MTPEEERQRLLALAQTGLLDTPDEERFDRFTRLAARILDTPIALISLVDESRQWFKSRVGLDARQTPREHAFCAHAIEGDGMMLVSDATDDPRFGTNPLVTGAPHIRFYAGAPLVLPAGQRLGTLCVIDTKPRVLVPEARAALNDLAAAVVDQIVVGELARLQSRQLAVLTMAENVAEMGHWQWIATTGEVTWSDQMFRVHSRAPSALPPAFDLIHQLYDPADQEAVRRALVAARDSGKDFELTVRIQLQESVGHLFLAGQCHKSEFNQIESIFGVAQDVTQQRELQGRLAHAEKMASVGTLAAGVAHEVNNPLSFMKANADLLAQEVAEIAGASPSVRLREIGERVDEIREGTTRIQRIVKGLKTFSRVSAARRELVELEPVLAASIRLAGHELSHRAVILCDFDRDTPIVLGDEPQLVQVAVNLLVNATHAIPDGSQADNQVTVSCGRTSSGDAFFSVEDSGHGMTPEVVERAFTPFFTTKPMETGTGLGLAISHGIIQSHGGTIGIESSPGLGTAIRVELPRAPTDVLVPPERETPPLGSAGVLSILIVDDDELVARSFARLLRDHKVTTRQRAAVALEELAGGQQYDVVVCDLMMPNVSGLHFQAELNRRVPEMARRLIFITGGTTESVPADARGITPTVLEKPLDILALHRAIREITERERPVES